METQLTKQDILDLFEKQSKNLEKQSKYFETLLIQEREERIKSRKEIEEADKLFALRLEEERNEREKSRKEFDKKLGELAGTWGKFVAEMVKPRIIKMFGEKGVKIETALQSVVGFKNGQKYYEIDLLLINTNIVVAVEIKSTLTVDDVIEHLERLDKIKEIAPKRIDLKGVTILGAVAGMIVENNADKFAYKKGLYVLRQKGNIVEIVNDEKFVPKEWKVEY